MRIGQGYDVHRLTEGRKLILGGVDIPYDKGLLGHSDADVLSHAIMDALLGAAGIAVRSGLHCAPLAHDTAGTLQTGTVRLSVSPFNTPREIDRAADVIENILKNSYKL